MTNQNTANAQKAQFAQSAQAQNAQLAQSAVDKTAPETAPQSAPIHIIDDDRLFANCLARHLRTYETRIFTNAIEAIAALNDETPPLIFLDILLDGPDGFTYLNELASYAETAKIPVVIISSLNLPKNLPDYGVVKILNKSTLTPADLQSLAQKYTTKALRKNRSQNPKDHSQNPQDHSQNPQVATTEPEAQNEQS